MEKSLPEKLEASTVEHEEHSPPDLKQSSLTGDNEHEHSLTLADVYRNHKAIIGWSFYWAMCAIGWGFDAQINGAVISIASFRRDFGYVADGVAILPASWQSAFNVCSSVGQFFGGFLCSWVADRIGRRASLLCGVIICTGGIFGEIFSASRGAFLASKIILGFGLGFYLTLGPLMCSELSPVVLRGLSTAGLNLGISIGQLLSNAVIKGFGDRVDKWAYAGPFCVQLFFTLFLLVGLPFSPESPWYLVRANNPEEAKKSLQRLWGKGFDVTPKLAAIHQSVEEAAQQGEASFVDCFRGTNLLRTSISTGIFACQHLAGIIFVLGYSTYFFELAGLDVSHAFSLGIGVTACGVLGNFVSWFVVNSYGRRWVFVLGMATLTVLLLLIGIMDVIPTNGASWVQASCTVVYAFIYFMTIGAMAFVLLGEVPTSTLRARTAALATATQSVCGITMNVIMPYMVNPDQANMKGKVGFVFGGLAFLGTLWSFIYVPELKGRTFAEIDTLFINRVPPRKMGSYQIN
ncbi:maltose permease [Aspergillus bertholletiae]|uniref:Maltose permease n=1 Tax=Aspergillus bertholletiae TaxID=1226010 RepID=A0A5N7ASL9_9EURO|nr:maltose permease [Aspergillus bertholletiae]